MATDKQMGLMLAELKIRTVIQRLLGRSGLFGCEVVELPKSSTFAASEYQIVIATDYVAAGIVQRWSGGRELEDLKISFRLTWSELEELYKACK